MHVLRFGFARQYVYVYITNNSFHSSFEDYHFGTYFGGLGGANIFFGTSDLYYQNLMFDSKTFRPSIIVLYDYHAQSNCMMTAGADAGFQESGVKIV